MTAQWKITGKGAGGQCEHCPRRLATHYVITSDAGQTMKVGRGCLKKITGWTVTAAQAEAAVRLAARDARWSAWCARNPDEAAVITARAGVEAGEIRQGLRATAGPAQELKTYIADNGADWRVLLAEWLGYPAGAR